MRRLIFVILRGLIVAVAALWLIAVTVLWAFQDRFVFPAAYWGVDSVAATKMNAAGFTRREIVTADGLRLTFWAATPRPGMPVILLFHGNGIFGTGHLDDMKGFAAAGYGVVLAEYRGFDGNPGHPSEAGLFADANAYGTWAASLWPSAKLVAWGESLGTGVAVDLAATHPVSAVILDAPYTSVTAAAEVQYPWAPVGPLLRNPFDSLSRLPQVAAPLLVMQGEADPIIPVAEGRQMLAASPCPAGGVFIPRLRHPAFINDTSGQARQAVIAFLDKLRAGTLSCRHQG